MNMQINRIASGSVKSEAAFGTPVGHHVILTVIWIPTKSSAIAEPARKN